MELFYILSSLITLVVLICFFVLCANISKIKANTNPATFIQLHDLYERHLFFGNKPEALNVYYQLIWMKRKEIKGNTVDLSETIIKRLNDLPNLFPDLEKLGGKWPVAESKEPLK